MNVQLKIRKEITKKKKIKKLISHLETKTNPNEEVRDSKNLEKSNEARARIYNT